MGQKLKFVILALMLSLVFIQAGYAAVYWVSTNGAASWANARSDTPLSGMACCSLTTANANVIGGDTVFLRQGIYNSGVYIHPSHSGTSDNNQIRFQAYDNEDVTITESAYGIRLSGHAYICVSGIRFFNIRIFFYIRAASHHNRIGYCQFDTRHPNSGSWQGGLIFEQSTHNHIHDCTFFRWAYDTYSAHRGGLLDIGNSGQGDEDASYYNLIERNVFAYGGHHTIGIYSKYNVIRDNYTHNETNAANWNFEGYRAALTEGTHAGYCLYEGNRFAYAGASGLALRSQKNIIRRNVFCRNGSGAIQVVSNIAGVDHADNNHIYHNVFYQNGYQPDYINFRGGIYFSSWSGQSPVGNVIKNNIFFDNRDGCIRYDGTVTAQIIQSNWEQNGNDPGFSDLSGGDPEDDTRPDLHLNAGSDAIDGGSSLTTIMSIAGTGTQFIVADARYFTNGWGIDTVAGDEIQLAGCSQKARIINVEYESNRLTLDTPVTWTQGQGISLTYHGNAPDLGAYEHEVGEPVLRITSPNGAEIWRRGEQRTISWTSNGIEGNLTIELLQSDSVVGTISSAVPVSAGAFTWMVGRLENGSYTTGSNLKIRIRTPGGSVSTSMGRRLSAR